MQARLDELSRSHREHRCAASDVVRPSSITELAAAIGMHRRNLQRYVAEGVPASHTDDIAIALGLLDTEMWPEIIDHEIADLTRTCAAPECDETFVLAEQGDGGGNRRYCSFRCKKREAMRRYRSRPHGRANDARYARAYRADVAESRRRRAARENVKKDANAAPAVACDFTADGAVRVHFVRSVVSQAVERIAA